MVPTWSLYTLYGSYMAPIIYSLYGPYSPICSTCARCWHCRCFAYSVTPRSLDLLISTEVWETQQNKTACETRPAWPQIWPYPPSHHPSRVCVCVCMAPILVHIWSPYMVLIISNSLHEVHTVARSPEVVSGDATITETYRNSTYPRELCRCILYNHESWIVNRQSEIINHQSSIMNHEPWTMSHDSSIMNHESWIIWPYLFPMAML